MAKRMSEKISFKPTEPINKIPMNQNEKNDKKSTLKKTDKTTSDFTKVLVAKSKNLQGNSVKSAIIYDENLLKELKEIIAKYTEHPEILDEINVKYSGNQEKLEEVDAEMQSNFIERLNIDSVDFVEIIVDTEEKFGIKIEDEEVKKIVNFEEMYLMIQSKIEDKKLNKTKKSAKTAKTTGTKDLVVTIKEKSIKKPVKKASEEKPQAQKVAKKPKVDKANPPAKAIKKTTKSSNTTK